MVSSLSSNGHASFLNSAESSSSSATSSESTQPAIKRIRGSDGNNPSQATTPPFIIYTRLSLMGMPLVLSSTIFSNLPFEELMRSKNVCRFVNTHISRFASIHYVFSRFQKKFTKQIFFKCLQNSLLNTIRTIDLSATDVNSFKEVLNHPLPALTALTFSYMPKRSAWQPPMDVEEIPKLLTAHAPNLTALNFNGNWKSRDLLQLLLPKLRHLDLWGCYSISVEQMLFLSKNSPQLQYLSLKECRCHTDSLLNLQYKGEGLLSALKFSELRELNLEALEALEMDESHLNEEIAALSLNCPKLTSLTIPGTGYNEDAAFLELSRMNFPLLEHLDISGWCFDALEQEERLIENFSIFVKQTPLLTTLSWSYLNEVEKILPLFAHLSQLTSLNFTNNHLDDEQFVEISKSCSQLKVLSFSNADSDSIGITNEGLLKSIFPNLTHLDFSNCLQITEGGLGILSRNCPKLTYLNLTCDFHELAQTTALELTHLMLPELTQINISGYKDLSGFNRDVLLALKKNCPKLKEVICEGTLLAEMGLDSELRDLNEKKA